MINEQLVALVESMEKSEKRHFKLMNTSKSKSEKRYRYIQLFEVIEKRGAIDLKRIEKVLPGLTSKQLSDLKSKLYYRLLKSLRMLYSGDSRIELRESIDYAHVLYDRGLFMQSLAILDKAKAKAWRNELHVLVLEIIAFEKRIEARHVTNSHEDRAQELSKELIYVRAIIQSEVVWSDLSLELYSKYLKIGHVKNSQEHTEVKAFFESRLPRPELSENRGFKERLFRLQSLVWYYYISQDFLRGYRYSLEWVTLCEGFPSLVRLDPKTIIKGYHNCLSNLFYCLDETRHQEMLQRMEGYINTQMADFNENARQMAFTYYNMAHLNGIILSCKFSESRSQLKKLDKQLSNPSNNVDPHRLMVFWYKIGSIYFTMGDLKRCIHFLNRIINANHKDLREDVQCFARILNLVAHFELGNQELIPYHFKSVYRFLRKTEELQSVQEEILKFIRATVDLSEAKLRKAFIALKERLVELRKDPFENRAFLYLDIIAWLESHIEGRPVEDVIKANRGLA